LCPLFYLILAWRSDKWKHRSISKYPIIHMTWTRNYLRPTNFIIFAENFSYSSEEKLVMNLGKSYSTGTSSFCFSFLHYVKWNDSMIWSLLLFSLSRDGVSEGQFEHVLEYEINAIKTVGHLSISKNRKNRLNFKWIQLL
jgi:hypothetical protein